MATRIYSQPNLAGVQRVRTPSAHASKDLQPLSDHALAHLNSLLFPQNGFYYLYQIVTPWTVRKILEFSFDLKALFQQIDLCCKERGIVIKQVFLTRKAVHAILIKQEGIPPTLDFDIRVEAGTEQSLVDEAVLTAFQKIAQIASGNHEIVYDFFKTKGLKTSYVSTEGRGALFILPVKRGDAVGALHFRVSDSPDGDVTFSTGCIQIDVASLFLGQGPPPSMSASAGFDLQEAYTLAQKGQFDIRAEGAAAAPQAVFEYHHLLTAGNYPRSLRGEIDLWEGLLKEIGTEEIKKRYSERLLRYLEEHYKNDLRGSIFYLFNAEDFIARAPGCEHKTEMREAIAELLANRFQLQTPLNPELFLAHCKVHLFLSLLKDPVKSKFYFDRSDSPVYRMFPEGRAISLFTEFPVHALQTVLTHWNACLETHKVLEVEFPLGLHQYEGLIRRHLTSLRSTDYPAQQETLNLLRFVCGENSAEVPRFLQGMIERLQRLSSTEERLQLIENELALVNLFRKDDPLTLNRLRADPAHCEEALVEEFCGSADPEFISLALEMAGKVLEKKGSRAPVLRLLMNPAAQADPRARTYAYETLSSVGDEDPRVRLSLFLLYRSTEKSQEEARCLISLLNANREAALTEDEKRRLKESAVGLFPTLLVEDVSLARALLDTLEANPNFVDAECRRGLCCQLVSTLLTSAQASFFESGLEFLRTRFQEMTPNGAAASLKGALAAVKDASRFKQIVAAIKELRSEYFSAQQANIEECMKRVRHHFQGCLLEVVDLVSAVGKAKRSEWIQEVLKLKSQNALACCKIALENSKDFGFLERDPLFLRGYIQLAASYKDKHPQAVAFYLQKEEWLLKQLDANQFVPLFLTVFPLLSKEAQAEEKRFSTVFEKIERAGTFEIKGEAFALFFKQFNRGCSEPLALNALAVLRGLSIKNLKTEAGVSLFDQSMAFVKQAPLSEPVLRSFVAVFSRMRESLTSSEGHLYGKAARNMIGLLMDKKCVGEDADRSQKWRVDEAISILRFAIEKKACEEAVFFDQMKQVMVKHKEAFSIIDLKGILKLAVEAGASFKHLEQEPFISIVLPLFGVVRQLIASATQDAEVQGLVVLWTAFCHGQQKRCGRANPQTVSLLAMTEVQLRSAAALQILEIPYTNGHTAGGGDPNYRRGISEAEQAVASFIQAADQRLFFLVSHMRQGFAELSVGMLRCESLRVKVLPLIKPRNFAGRDYFDLIERMLVVYQESSDPQLLKELYHAVSFVLLNPDLAQALSVKQMKSLVNDISFFALQQLRTSEKEDSESAVKYALRCLQLFADAGGGFPAVVEYCGEREEEFLAGLLLIFEEIVKIEDLECLAEFANCLIWVQKNNVVIKMENVNAMALVIPDIQQRLVRAAEVREAMAIEQKK